MKSNVLIVLTVTIILIVLYSQLYNKIEINKEESTVSKYRDNRKIVLYWHKMFQTMDFYMGLGEKVFAQCPINNCYLTHNKSYLPSITQFDGIMFHGVEYQEKTHQKPALRSPHQKYIFYDLEPPVYSNSFMAKTTNFYNWTMTYRLDSDIFRPYGYYKPSKTNYKLPSVEDISKRPKKIAWFVSRCKSDSKREYIVKELNKYIPVDIYGKCGTLTCTRKDEDACYKMLEEDYKFYLSFENAICQDYVTEKTFNILQRNIVPVVYGGANYNNMTPPNSVIDIMSFTSVRSLANHLKFLDENPDEYLRYFEWKKSYQVQTSVSVGLCNLCRKLNENSTEQVIGDISGWWKQTKGLPYCTNTFAKYFLNEKK